MGNLNVRHKGMEMSNISRAQMKQPRPMTPGLLVEPKVEARVKADVMASHRKDPFGRTRSKQHNAHP